MTQQTTIEWECSPTAGHDTHGQSAVYDASTGKDIAVVYDGEAHGAMIAATPAALEACRKLARLGDWTGPAPKGFTQAWEAAMHAIAKVKGGAK